MRHGSHVPIAKVRNSCGWRKFVKFDDPAPGTEAPQRPAINLTQKAWSALILTRYGVAIRMRAAIFQSVALAFGLTMLSVSS